MEEIINGSGIKAVVTIREFTPATFKTGVEAEFTYYLTFAGKYEAESNPFKAIGSKLEQDDAAAVEAVKTVVEKVQSTLTEGDFDLIEGDHNGDKLLAMIMAKLKGKYALDESKYQIALDEGKYTVAISGSEIKVTAIVLVQDKTNENNTVNNGTITFTATFGEAAIEP